jgi:type IV secretion system protein VirD4
LLDKLIALTSRVTALACRMTLVASCGLVARAAILIVMRFPFAGVLLLAAIAWKRRNTPPPDTSHGSAATASLKAQERAGLLGDQGLILGRCLAETPPLAHAVLGLVSPQVNSQMACRTFFAACYHKRWLTDRLIRINNHVHLFTCSPTGGGKGVAVLKPNLLAYPGNCVVVDPGGDLYKTTARHRERQFGHRIIRIDACECFGPGDTLNPLDRQFIDPRADDFVERCADLADQMVIRQQDEKEPHWNESAIKNVKALAAFVCGAEPDPGKRHLGTVRSLAASRARYALAVQTMQQMGDACQGVIARLGGSLTWHEGEELASVMATLDRHTCFLDSPAVARCLASSSFDPAILRTGRATVYLILPHDRLATMSRLQRLLIGTIMRRSTQVMPNEHNPVMWFLDEMGHIGHMQAIEDAATLMRSQGVRLWMFFQSLDQLKICFGDKAPIVLDNCGTQQFFGINSLGTARELSERSGTATIETASANRSRSISRPFANAKQEGGNTSSSDGVTYNQTGRKLFLPEEILTLPDDVALVFHKNLPVIRARLVRYFKAREFRRGGTGRPRRLGLAAVLLAAFTLLASSFVTAAALAFVGRAALHRTAGRPATRAAARSHPPGRLRPAPARAAAVRRSRARPQPRGRQGGSGFLIRIQ